MNDILFVGEHVKTYRVQWHYHQNWELVYCTGGAGAFEFRDRERLEYAEGELVAIPPQVWHMNAGQEGFTNIHIVMDDPTFPKREPFRVKDDVEQHLRETFTQARYFYLSDEKKKEPVLSALGSLIAALISMRLAEHTYPEPVEQIRNLIIKNFDDPDFELDEMIRSLNFNYDYLRKLFRRELGMTPLEYMTGLRLRKAVNILLTMEDREYSMTEIAERCGYENPLYFSRLFRKHYGCAPSAYAQENRANKAKDSEETKRYGE